MQEHIVSFTKDDEAQLLAAGFSVTKDEYGNQIANYNDGYVDVIVRCNPLIPKWSIDCICQEYDSDTNINEYNTLAELLTEWAR